MNKTVIILVGAGFLILALSQATGASPGSIVSAAQALIQGFERFDPHPYWDVKRYSWGYGTPAPGPDGTITREQAAADMLPYIQPNYEYLLPMIARPLNINQWAALLSFAYNVGPGNADNLVTNINSGDDGALETQWKKYILAGGVVSSDLIDRRDKEWQVWIS